VVFHEMWGIDSLQTRAALVTFPKVSDRDRVRVSAVSEVANALYRERSSVLSKGFSLRALMCRLKSQQRVIRSLNDYRHR